MITVKLKIGNYIEGINFNFTDEEQKAFKIKLNSVRGTMENACVTLLREPLRMTIAFAEKNVVVSISNKEYSDWLSIAESILTKGATNVEKLCAE